MHLLMLLLFLSFFFFLRVFVLLAVNIIHVKCGFKSSQNSNNTSVWWVHWIVTAVLFLLFSVGLKTDSTCLEYKHAVRPVLRSHDLLLLDAALADSLTEHEHTWKMWASVRHKVDISRRRKRVMGQTDSSVSPQVNSPFLNHLMLMIRNVNYNVSRRVCNFRWYWWAWTWRGSQLYWPDCWQERWVQVCPTSKCSGV